ncbi:MAG: hypothetical protein GX419_03215 [Bacteroidales bacterium]|nr:hypothetical protein [Bacteroidales bacterium]
MKKSSRRRFLASSAGLLGAGLAGLPVLAETNRNHSSERNASGMIYRTLGRTGIRVPVVSMGVMNASNPNLVKEAWKSGIRHFDTAWIYQNGNNELMVGRVLKELQVRREDVILASKVFLHDKRGVQKDNDLKDIFLQRFHQSLERLQTDYIDILYLHDVSDPSQVNAPWLIDTFSELKKSKKIRWAGFSTHTYWPELVKDAADKGFYDVILLSINYSMSHDTASLEAMNYAAAKGVGLIAMKTQCQQAWYKENLPAEMQKFYEGKIMHSALLKWVLRHESIATAVPGFTTFQQLEEDMAVATNLEYTSDELKFLTDHNVQLALNANCRFCGKCLPGCPHNVHIPTLMRAHMYAYAYGNVHMTRQTLSGQNGLEACAKCDVCTAQCVNDVPIARRIGEIIPLLG